MHWRVTTRHAILISVSPEYILDYMQSSSNCYKYILLHVIMIASLQAIEVFSASVSDIDPTEVDALVERLVVITNSSTTGGSTNFAADLQTTNDVVSLTVEYLLVTINNKNSTAPLEFNKVYIYHLSVHAYSSMCLNDTL